MILSAHQPAYIPWMGYFEKIERSDIFIYMDTVQFEKNSFINRNKIKTPQGPQWLTIPVKAKDHINGRLIDINIDDAQAWRSKHSKAIQLNYSKARHYKELFPKIENQLYEAESSLVELCWKQLNFWIREFEIKTKIVRLSDLSMATKKSDLILDLCKYYSADRYLSGALGVDYLIEDDFKKFNIEIKYQKFEHPVYSQLWGEFERNMAIVDYWMCLGPGKIKFHN